MPLECAIHSRLFQCRYYWYNGQKKKKRYMQFIWTNWLFMASQFERRRYWKIDSLNRASSLDGTRLYIHSGSHWCGVFMCTSQSMGLLNFTLEQWLKESLNICMHKGKVIDFEAGYVKCNTHNAHLSQRMCLRLQYWDFFFLKITTITVVLRNICFASIFMHSRCFWVAFRI